MDRRRAWDCARLTYRRLVVPTKTSRAAYARVVADPSWAADLVEAQDEMLELGVEFRAQWRNSLSPKRAARALIRAGHQLTERVAKPLLATVLASYRDSDYGSLRSRDIGDLLQQMQDAGLGSLTFGLDRALRHADAHKLFTETDDGVIFTAEKREYDFLTWAQLLDRVLGGYESAIALLMAATCALPAIGSDLSLIDASHKLGFSAEERLALIVALCGWKPMRVTIEGPSAEILATSSELPQSRGFIGALIAPLGSDVEYLTIRLLVDSAEHTWSGPVGTLRRWNAETNDSLKERLFVEAMLGWEHDGRPFISREQLRKIVASKITTTVTGESTPAHMLRVTRAMLWILASSPS